MERFQNLLSKIGDNYKESYIVDNECFLYGGADRKKFDHLCYVIYVSKIMRYKNKDD